MVNEKACIIFSFLNFVNLEMRKANVILTKIVLIVLKSGRKNFHSWMVNLSKNGNDCVYTHF